MTEAERRLVAILFTDIVGYTALVERDERQGIQAREDHRRLIQTLADQFKGEFVDESGDASLAIFPSAVDAVKCAMAIQAVLAADPKLQVRAGIHVGDVVERDGRLIGDGINVASRLPALAEPGGIVATQQVVEHLRNQRIATASLGARQLKNVTEPVAVFSVGSSAKGARVAPRRARHRAILVGGLAVLALAGVWLFLLGGKEEVLLTAFRWGWFDPTGGQTFKQEIAFTNTSDGVRIAYSTAGKADGPPVVMVLGWATHLEKGMSRPGLNPWVRGLVDTNRVVVYDGRGSGLSDRQPADVSLDARVRDLEAVADAAGLGQFGIIAVSAGGPTSVAYTAKHPERVSRIAFYGSFLSFASMPSHHEMWRSFPELVRTSWGSDNPVFRQLFTNLFYPDGDALTLRFFNEMQAMAMTPDDAADFISSIIETDVRDLAPAIRVPTLVIHRRGDQVVPYGLGREIAALVPGARLAGMDGLNHAPSFTERATIEELDALMRGFFAPGT